MIDFAAEIENLAAAEARRSIATVADLEDLRKRIAAGTATSVAHPNGRQAIDAVLGIDFGTSSTKIVARLPYLAGAPAFAVPVPRFAQAEGHPHLWASRIWLDAHGRFSLEPTADGHLLCGIKSRLMQPFCDRVIALVAGDHSPTVLEVATAFLTLQIRQARGWLLTNCGREFGRGPLRWSHNIGFPAASLDAPELGRFYKICGAASVKLSELQTDVSVDAVRTAITSVAQDVDREMQRQQVFLIPEIAAAVAPFAQSSLGEDGLYAMIDVGAGTLDCCTFGLQAVRSEPKCSIFAADVFMLGVQPWRVCEGDDELEHEFAREIELRERQIVWTTKVRRFRSSERWQTGLPVFLIGGGAQSSVHRAATRELDPWLQKNLGSKVGARLLDLPPPKGLSHQTFPQSLHRLSTAIGLSLPVVDIPLIALPRSIEDDTLLPSRQYEDLYVAKEMT